MVKHEQFPFVTHNGKIVEVDGGLYEILRILRDMGLRTQYSCEDNLGQAYIVMGNIDWLKLRTRMAGSGLHRRFIYGARSLEFSLFLQKGTRRLVETTLYLTPKRHRGYKVEHTISNTYGFRTTLRWPAEDNQRFLETLQQIKEA